MCEMKDDNDEMPADFDNEIHKWSLECEYIYSRPSELSADNCLPQIYSMTDTCQHWVNLQVSGRLECSGNGLAIR